MSSITRRPSVLCAEDTSLLEGQYYKADAAPPKITDFQAWLGLVRASIGPGAMALPYAFSSAGLPTSMWLLCGLCAIIFYNMVTLVQLKRHHHAATDGAVTTYGAVGEACAGKWGRRLVETSLVCMELGICTVYFSYCATNLAAAFLHTTPANANSTALHRDDDAESSRRLKLLMLGLYPVLAGLAMIREMKTLALLSGLANAFMAVGLVIIYYYLIDHEVDEKTIGSTDDEIPPDNGKHLLLTLATIIYSFEGCGAILPTENSMQKPENFYKICTYCFATYLVVYASVGGLGVSSFRFDEVVPADDRGSISAVIAYFYTSGADKDVVKALNALLAIAVAMTYPLQFYAAIEVIEDLFGIGNHPGTTDGPPVAMLGTKRMVIRAVLVACTLCIAVGIPKLNLVIAFFGALFGGSIELVLPPLLFAVDKGCREQGMLRPRYVFNLVLLVVGLVATLSGTGQALANIWEATVDLRSPGVNKTDL